MKELIKELIERNATPLFHDLNQCMTLLPYILDGSHSFEGN